MLRYADDHQQAQALIHPDIAVDAIIPPVHVAAATQVSLTQVPVFLDPVLLQPTDGVGRQTFSPDIAYLNSAIPHFRSKLRVISIFLSKYTRCSSIFSAINRDEKSAKPI